MNDDLYRPPVADVDLGESRTRVRRGSLLAYRVAAVLAMLFSAYIGWSILGGRSGLVWSPLPIVLVIASAGLLRRQRWAARIWQAFALMTSSFSIQQAWIMVAVGRDEESSWSMSVVSMIPATLMFIVLIGSSVALQRRARD